MASVMTGVQRNRAKDIGADTYLRSKRFRTLKEDHIFAALDAGVETMQKLKFPDPFNGQVLGAMAAAIVTNDEKALGHMSLKKVGALVEGDQEEREELLGLVGLLIAERYLDSRKGQIPTETRIVPPGQMLERLGDVFEEMAEAGREMTQVSVMDSEIALTLTKEKPDAGNIAEALIGEVIGSYESVVPLATTDGDLPDAVQRRAAARAAFLRLGVEDLGELVAERGITDVPTKAAMAKALAEAYEDDLDEVARLTLRKTEGDPAFGLITRLLPLGSPPDLGVAKVAFEGLRGHYLEVAPASFFVYGQTSLSPDGRFLTIEGSMRSFTVAPTELAGEAQLNPRPRKDEIKIVLEDGLEWAVVTARRASDLAHIGAVLRRSGEVSAAPGVPPPDPLDHATYGAWDPRSLWILDLFRRDLQADDLRLEETLMANFDAPGAVVAAAEEEGERGAIRLASVKLRGRRLQDHPEVCARIVERSHLKDVEFRVRRVIDKQRNFTTLTKVRLVWERSHIAVMTGADGDTVDIELHDRLVRIVREAAERPLGGGLLPILQRIETRAGESDVDDDAEGVIEGTAGDEGQEAA